jgi:S1-C subfamily serine protease
VLEELPETAEVESRAASAVAHVGPAAARSNSSSVITAIIVAVGAGVSVFFWMNQTRPVPAGSDGTVVMATSAPVAPRQVTPMAEAVASDSAPVVPGVEPAAPAAPLVLAKDAAPAPTAVAPPPVASLPLEDVIGRAMPAVVRVESAGGFGSGFFVAPDTILTNVHVVGRNSSVTIRRTDGTTTTARVETTAEELDIAIMRISNPSPDQPTLPMGSGMSARPGQEVFALGTPLGLQNTVTRGIVSAVRDVGGVTLVQTDAAINPGNSGGPLLDRAGSVIGIATMGMRSSVAQGLSFGVAIEHAQSLMAGRRSPATGTPMSSLNQAMSGKPGALESDTVREEAGRAFEQAIAALARKADALDGLWSSFKTTCYEGRVVGSFDHEWFAFWNPRAMQGVVSPGCGPSFADIRGGAEGIRNGVLGAEETARRADVYPGQRRDILKRYRLAYTGWEH